MILRPRSDICSVLARSFRLTPKQLHVWFRLVQHFDARTRADLVEDLEDPFWIAVRAIIEGSPEWQAPCP